MTKLKAVLPPGFVPQMLTWEQAKAAAKDFYDKGLLTAQASDAEQAHCTYIGPAGKRCAIGAGLNEEVCKIIAESDADRNDKYGEPMKGLNARDVGVLIIMGLVSASEADWYKIAGLQDAHDHWANCVHNRENDAAKVAEERFLECLAMS